MLKSEADGTWYTGMTGDLQQRLREHNAGKSTFTKGPRPWMVLYTEQTPDWKAAREREKYLKSAAGKKWLKKLLDTGNRGSLPG